jgi:hypothetical protein
MIAKCFVNRGRDVPHARTLPVLGGWKGLLVLTDTVFDLTVGHTYVVNGMGLYNDGLILLVLDSASRPSWYPIEIFEVEDPRLPSTWEFSTGPQELQACWGYPEPVHSEEHRDALIDRDPRALTTFQRWKSLIDDESS